MEVASAEIGDFRPHFRQRRGGPAHCNGQLRALAYELAISLRNPCRNLGHRFTLQSTPSTLHDPLASYSRAALGNGWTTRKAIQGPSNNVVELRSFHFGLVYTENSNTLGLL